MGWPLTWATQRIKNGLGNRVQLGKMTKLSQLCITLVIAALCRPLDQARYCTKLPNLGYFLYLIVLQCLRFTDACLLSRFVVLSPVYTIQPVVKLVVKPIWQPVWQLAVSCIQPVVKPVEWTVTVPSTWLSNWVWQPVVSCKRGIKFIYCMLSCVTSLEERLWNYVKWDVKP